MKSTFEAYKSFRKKAKSLFNSIADSVKTKKENISNDFFNNPDFRNEISKIKNGKERLSFNFSDSENNMITEKESLNNIVEKDEHELKMSSNSKNNNEFNDEDHKKVNEFFLFSKILKEDYSDDKNSNRNEFNLYKQNDAVGMEIISKDKDDNEKNPDKNIELSNKMSGRTIPSNTNRTIEELSKDNEANVNNEENNYVTETGILNTNSNLLRKKTKNIFLDYSTHQADEYVKPTPLSKFRKAYLKVTILLLFKYIWNRMKFFGLKVLRGEIESEIKNFEANKINIIGVESNNYSTDSLIQNFSLNPKSIFFDIWNVVRLLLIIYSLTYMEYLICILNRFELWSAPFILEYLVELFFLVDIIIIFFTAYEVKGTLIKQNKKIMIRYLKTWFIVDLLGVFPFEFFYYDYKDINYHYLPNYSFHRLIRIIRFTRIYDILAYFENSKTVNSIVKIPFVEVLIKKLKMNAAIKRLINILLIIFCLSHIFACLWYYSAHLVGINENTWVRKIELADLKKSEIYLVSIYYSLTVVTTVGFGDITSGTNVEKILTCLWMIIGVAFYSFVISNLSSIISSMDFNSILLEKKLDALNEFSTKLGIPDHIYMRIRKNYEENDNQYFIQDEYTILEDLPYNLRVEILFHIHHEQIQSTVYFLERSINLVVDIITKWKSLSYESEEFLYIKDENSFDSKNILI